MVRDGLQHCLVTFNDTERKFLDFAERLRNAKNHDNAWAIAVDLVEALVEGEDVPKNTSQNCVHFCRMSKDHSNSNNYRLFQCHDCKMSVFQLGHNLAALDNRRGQQIIDGDVIFSVVARRDSETIMDAIAVIDMVRNQQVGFVCMTNATRFSSYLGYNMVLSHLCEKMGVIIIQSKCIGTVYTEVAAKEQLRQDKRKAATDKYEKTVANIKSDDPHLYEAMNALYKAKANHMPGGNANDATAIDTA